MPEITAPITTSTMPPSNDLVHDIEVSNSRVAQILSPLYWLDLFCQLVSIILCFCLLQDAFT
jgi:hypothetical protein